MSVFKTLKQAEKEAFRYKKRAERLRKRVVFLKRQLEKLTNPHKQ